MSCSQRLNILEKPFSIDMLSIAHTGYGQPAVWLIANKPLPTLYKATGCKTCLFAHQNAYYLQSHPTC